MEEKLRFFIAKTSINCKGEADVTFLCSENNKNGSYYSADFNNPNMVLFDTEKAALNFSKRMASWSVHGTWTK